VLLIEGSVYSTVFIEVMDELDLSERVCV